MPLKKKKSFYYHILVFCTNAYIIIFYIIPCNKLHGIKKDVVLNVLEFKWLTYNGFCEVRIK